MIQETPKEGKGSKRKRKDPARALGDRLSNLIKFFLISLGLNGTKSTKKPQPEEWRAKILIKSIVRSNSEGNALEHIGAIDVGDAFNNGLRYALTKQAIARGYIEIFTKLQEPYLQWMIRYYPRSREVDTARTTQDIASYMNLE